MIFRVPTLLNLTLLHGNTSAIISYTCLRQVLYVFAAGSMFAMTRALLPLRLADYRAELVGNSHREY